MLFCSEQGLQGRLWKSNVIPCNLVDSPGYKLFYEAWVPLIPGNGKKENCLRCDKAQQDKRQIRDLFYSWMT